MREAIHETQNQNEPVGLLSVHDSSPPPETFELQQLEGTVPERKSDFSAMPSPIRYFSYFFFTSSAVLLVIGIFYQLFK